MRHVARKSRSAQRKRIKGSVCLLGRSFRGAGSNDDWEKKHAKRHHSRSEVFWRGREKHKGASAAARSGRKSAAPQANDEKPLDLTPHPRLIPGLSDRSDPKSGSPLDEGGSRRSPGPSADRYAPSQEFRAFPRRDRLLRHPSAATGGSNGRETMAIISCDVR